MDPTLYALMQIFGLMGSGGFGGSSGPTLSGGFGSATNPNLSGAGGFGSGLQSALGVNPSGFNAPAYGPGLSLTSKLQQVQADYFVDASGKLRAVPRTEEAAAAMSDQDWQALQAEMGATALPEEQQPATARKGRAPKPGTVNPREQAIAEGRRPADKAPTTKPRRTPY